MRACSSDCRQKIPPNQCSLGAKQKSRPEKPPDLQRNQLQLKRTQNLVKFFLFKIFFFQQFIRNSRERFFPTDYDSLRCVMRLLNKAVYLLVYLFSNRLGVVFFRGYFPAQKYHV